MTVPHGIPAKDFIDWVNFNTQDEAKRCRILLAELLLRTEDRTLDLVDLEKRNYTKDALGKIDSDLLKGKF